MRIQGLRVDNFGIWSGLEIDNLPAGATVFYGANEAGKSTLMQFMRSVLYGFSSERSQRFMAEDGELAEVGGSLTVAVPEGQFRLSRFSDPRQPLAHPGQIKVSAISGSNHVGHAVTSLISSIDESIFQNVFAVGLSEMQYLGTLNDTQAAEQLYSLSTGTDRVSLVDVMRHLRAARMRLVTDEEEQAGNESNGRIAILLARRERFRKKIDELSTQSDRWAELYSRLHVMDQEVRDLEQGRDQLKREARLAETALRVRPKWEQWQTLNEEIKAIGPVPDLSPAVMEKLAALNEKIATHTREQEQLKQSRALLKQRADELPLSDALWRQSARIRVIAEQRNWVASLESDVQRLRSHLEESEFEIQAEQEKMGLTVAGSGRTNKRVTGRVLAALRKPARALKRDLDKLKTAKAESESFRSDAKRSQNEIVKVLSDRLDLGALDDHWNLVSAVEETGSMASSLRRFVQIDEVYQELKGQLEEAWAQRNDLLANQLLPIPVLTTLGLFFAGGAVFALCGLFGYNFAFQASSRWMMILIGMMIIGASVVMKLLLERSSLDELDACEDECELAEKQISGIRDERMQLKDRIPPGNAAPAERLREAEIRLGKLEELLPMDSQRRLVMAKAEQAEKVAIEAAKAMNESRRRWEAALRRQGLSPKLSPSQLKDMVSNNSAITQLQRRYEQLRDELDRTRRQYDVIQNQIQELVTDAHLDPISDSVLDQLDQLSDAVTRQEQLQETRESLRRQSRQIRRDQEKLNRTTHQQQARRSALIGSTGAEDEAELERLLERREQVQQLRNERDQLIRSISSLLASPVDEQKLGQELREQLTDDLPEQLRDKQANVQRTDSRLKELLERRGKIAQEIKYLALDRSLPEAQLGLGLAERRLQRGLRDWKTLSAVTQMIESVYQKYEKDRQPTTLKEASAFLERLTEGRYTRVWTPLADNILLVDDAQGAPLTIEMLSRGTREQVFLSLRLALASDYARRGIRMPLVLDDVLVNFDVDRTVAAAHVLRDFAAQGHQVLVFTCHEHIMEIFQRIGVEVRDIPRQHATPLRHVQPHGDRKRPHSAASSLDRATVARAAPVASLAAANQLPVDGYVQSDTFEHAGTVLAFDEPIRAPDHSDAGEAAANTILAGQFNPSPPEINEVPYYDESRYDELDSVKDREGTEGEAGAAEDNNHALDDPFQLDDEQERLEMEEEEMEEEEMEAEEMEAEEYEEDDEADDESQEEEDDELEDEEIGDEVDEDEVDEDEADEDEADEDEVDEDEADEDEVDEDGVDEDGVDEDEVDEEYEYEYEYEYIEVDEDDDQLADDEGRGWAEGGADAA